MSYFFITKVIEIRIRPTNILQPTVKLAVNVDWLSDFISLTFKRQS